MLFSSIPFLYYFLPLVLAVYFLTPRAGKNAVLFLSSLLFYAWGEPKFCIFMLLSILQGYAQVLWLDGVEKKYVEEVGSMNIMFKIDGKVYTAATVGTVLPGVTRRSCIELLKDWGYDVIEGKLAIADIMQAAREGKLEEVFGTGTAAVVSPVKELVWKGEHAYIGDGKIGPVTQKLYDTMTGMQWGKIPDTKGWIVPVEKKY